MFIDHLRSLLGIAVNSVAISASDAGDEGIKGFFAAENLCIILQKVKANYDEHWPGLLPVSLDFSPLHVAPHLPITKQETSILLQPIFEPSNLSSLQSTSAMVFLHYD